MLKKIIIYSDDGIISFLQDEKQFVMIYLTDTIGLNAGVIGVLIAVSKILEQQLSVFCSTLADSRAL